MGGPRLSKVRARTLRTGARLRPALRARGQGLAVDILQAGQHDLRVIHVPGAENGVADALSRLNLTTALQLAPNLKVSPFDPWTWSHNTNGSLSFLPPRSTLGPRDL
jgi:hypothetical protein